MYNSSVEKDKKKKGNTNPFNGAVEDYMEKRSSPPDPDPDAEGNSHTIVQIPGGEGQYTTYNEDGTYKQYRGSGKSHGDVTRPNVKENKIDESPKGPIPGNAKVRPAKPKEIPKG